MSQYLILHNNYHNTTYRKRADETGAATLTRADITRARHALCPDYYQDNPYTPCPCRQGAGPLNERGPQTAEVIRRAIDDKNRLVEITYRIIS